ncbi:MAG: hypothetical protein IKL70_03705 [Oscillospiraceae bacterium]|jgi:hypothetical protein|nr:hypothetical protein [Oscillospiraceae bacterium]MBQ5315380.1 hypothetical protein [Oscillospiraceae bacterium]MBQ7959041.1 hypothetical protein [Oscillospiraceae bacterium]MBQ8728047.1 hypothetical protein [Oscillospiraceae bacterium]MBR4092779.1 hypothetical protein [Oscillospiraceae bacterium]
MECELCAYYAYDEDYEDYVCTVNMDEDDMWRIMESKRKECPYFTLGDEYRIARKQ